LTYALFYAVNVNVAPQYVLWAAQERGVWSIQVYVLLSLLYLLPAEFYIHLDGLYSSLYGPEVAKQQTLGVWVVMNLAAIIFWAWWVGLVWRLLRPEPQQAAALTAAADAQPHVARA